MISQFGTDTLCGNPAAAPSLDPQGKTEGGIFLPILDLAQPTGAGSRESEFDCALSERQTALGSQGEKGRRGIDHGVPCSTSLNKRTSRIFQSTSTDDVGSFSHHMNMAAPLKHDWYLKEWFASLGLKQRDLVTKLDFQTQTAFNLWHSVQPYRRDHVEAISGLLNIQPFELLMPPEEAMALRRLRATIAEVARVEAPALTASQPDAKTGTDG